MAEPPPEPAATATPRCLTVTNLLLLRRPTTGAASLLPSQTSSSTSPPRKKPKFPSPSPSPNPATFAPISQPAILAGTLSLPSPGSPAACRNHCLSFSDPSSAASICCYLLDFDPAAVGREIRIIAWNYLPSGHGAGEPGGVLEVVRWCFAAPESVPNGNFLTTILLNCSDLEPDPATRGRVFGVLKSVSVVFTVPHAVQSKVDGDKNSVGFLAEMLCCGCDQCRVSPPESARNHNFEVVKLLYFVELARTWRPVLARLIGRLMSFSGLKKKMVFVGEKESYTMLVSTPKTMVAWGPSYVGSVPSDWKSDGKCGGVYTGVVTGVYVQGMVVELDEAAWLLIDDLQLAPSHSLRVGAVISVRNFRATRVNFAWTRIVLLRTCIRSSITVNSFSLVDSKCYIKSECKGLLGKFVDSLEMTSRFWMLLLICCFKQKFAKLFSEEEIVGSKDKQGWIHTYGTKFLSSKDFQPQHGFFMRFCNHKCVNSSTESNLEACKLVIPFSSFICKGESLWTSTILKFWNGAEEVGTNQRLNQFLCDGVSYPGTTKRIISSDDLGVVLVGSIKASSWSGQLQLVDATGCVDVVIPDLPPNASMDGIYEISDYKLALEGPVAYLDHYDFADPLSCKAIFEQFHCRKRVHHLMIYVIFYWRAWNRIDHSLHIPLHVANNNGARLFHLLILSHKFPASNNLQHQNKSGSSLFVEAMVVPYDLKFVGQGECIERAEDFKIACTHSLSNSKASIGKLCHIPCSLSFRTNNLHGTMVLSYSCVADGSILIDSVGGERKCATRILLEFKEETFIKYQSLRIGGYYLLQCPSESLRCIKDGCGCLKGGKVLVDSQDNLWSIAITFDGKISVQDAIRVQAIGVSPVKVGESFSRNSVQNELKFLKPWNDLCQDSDFHLDLSCEGMNLRMEQYDIRHHVLNGLCSYSSEVLSVSSCIQIMTPKKPCGLASLQSEKLVQGDLISLEGKVENIHSDDSKEGKFSSLKHMSGNDEKLNICIHVADDNHMVRLRGFLSKHAYPVGLGPGARVMLHRVLLTQRHGLLLTPVTYIEVNSISQVDKTEDESITLPLISDFSMDGSLSMDSPCLFAHQMHCTDGRPMRFHCRVVTVLMLVLDNCLCGLQNSQAIPQSKTPKVKIPLAGFILDDGSSLCCSWADGARAELLLRLQEVAELDVSVGLNFWKKGTNRNLRHTVGHYLEKILKKHKKVIIRNYGITPDSTCRDLELSPISDKVLSGLEEKVLKFIVLNACQGGTLNVTASVLNMKALNGLNVNLPDLSPARDMHNMWINEVSQVDPLEVAQRLFGSLGNS